MYQLDSSHVWHVAKQGSNSNSGHAGQYPVNLANDAKLTIAAAISAASAGDNIIVWPGTYSENVALTDAKPLNLFGTNRQKCVVAGSLAIGDYSYVKDLTVSYSGGSTAISMNCTDTILENVSAVTTSGIDGIHLYSGNRLIIRNCYATSKYDGIQVGNAQEVLIEDCFFETSGQSVGTSCRAFTTQGCKGIIVRNTIMKAMRGSGGSNDVIAANIEGSVLFENCFFYSDSDDETTYSAIGIHINNATGYALVRGGVIRVESEYGTSYGIKVSNGAIQLSQVVISVAASGAEYTGLQCTTQREGNEKTQFVDSTNPIPEVVPDNYWNYFWVIWTGGNNSGEKKQVSDWDTTDNYFTFSTGFTNDIEVGDEYTLTKIHTCDIKQSDSGIIRIANSIYDKNNIEGTIVNLDGITDIDGRVDVSRFNGSEDDVLRLNKATKLLTNKAIQNKSSGTIDYYDDDGQTIILTHTPSDSESTIERAPS